MKSDQDAEGGVGTAGRRRPHDRGGLHRAVAVEKRHQRARRGRPALDRHVRGGDPLAIRFDGDRNGYLLASDAFSIAALRQTRAESRYRRRRY